MQTAVATEFFVDSAGDEQKGFKHFCAVLIVFRRANSVVRASYQYGGGHGFARIAPFSNDRYCPGKQTLRDQYACNK